MNNYTIENKIKSPEQAQRSQVKYIKHVEAQAVENLITQFNNIISREPPGQILYIVNLYFNRPAGFYQMSNIINEFKIRVANAGWMVRHLTVGECVITITVSPSKVKTI